MRGLVTAACLWFVSGCAPCAPLEIERAGRVLTSFCVERAVTEIERREGLTNHPPLEPSEGLLIVFPVTGEACITNAPVLFPIDIAFIDEEGVITRLDRSVPAGDAELRCATTVASVLETSAGSLGAVDLGDWAR